MSQILKARENKTELFSCERNHTWHQFQFCLVVKALGRTEIMPVGFVVSFFNQINHVLLENKFCLLMAFPAFEVPHGTAGFEVGSEKRPSLLWMCVYLCVRFGERERERSVKHSFRGYLTPGTQHQSYDESSVGCWLKTGGKKPGSQSQI